jgi:hypothetical protein
VPVTTDIDKFRLELGDIPAAYDIKPVPPDTTLTQQQQEQFQAAALFNDDEATYFLTAHPTSVLLAVAAACDALAARFAQDVDTAEDGQSFKDSQKAERYQAMAVRFRQRAAVDLAGAQAGAGVPIGRVPARRATTWGERY